MVTRLWNLNQKLEKYYSHFPSSIEKLGNLIFYGPSGVGKYSQMLYAIKKYSHSELKYEKKMDNIAFALNFAKKDDQGAMKPTVPL